MNVLVDTSVLIDVLRGRPGRMEGLRRLVERGSILCSCDVTIAEVYAGMLERERVATEDLMGSLFYLPSDSQVARQAGLIRRDWRRRAFPIALGDAFLAAIAMRHDAALLTDNRRHFPMEGLVLWGPDDLQT